MLEESWKNFILETHTEIGNKDRSLLEAYVDPDIQFLMMGIGETDIYTTPQQFLDEMIHWLNTEAEDWRYEIINAQRVKSIVFGIFTSTVKIISDNYPVEHKFRTSIVLQEIEGDWKLRQFHGSVPEQFGDQERGWRSRKSIREQIDHWIEQFDLLEISQDEKERMIAYLIKAKAVISDD